MSKYKYEKTDALKYTCPTCGKVFKSVSESQIEYNINRHMTKHERQSHLTESLKPGTNKNES